MTEPLGILEDVDSTPKRYEVQPLDENYSGRGAVVVFTTNDLQAAVKCASDFGEAPGRIYDIHTKLMCYGWGWITREARDAHIEANKDVAPWTGVEETPLA